MRNLKETLKKAAISALFTVHFTEKENSRLAVQRIIQLCGNLLFPEKAHLEEKLLPLLLFYVVPRWSEWPHGSLMRHLPALVVWKSG